MNNITVSRKSIIILFLLLAGIIVTVVLIKKQTILKSRAAADIDYPSALNISDEQNQQLKYKGEGVYIIKSSKIKLGLKDANKLVQSKQLDLTTEYATNSRNYNADQLIQQGYKKLSGDEVAQFCSGDNSWYCAIINWSVVKGMYELVSSEGSYRVFVTSQYPPLSEIPSSCQSIGPSKIILSPPATRLSVLMTPEEYKAWNERLQSGAENQQYREISPQQALLEVTGGKWKVGIDQPLHMMMDIAGVGYSSMGLLPYKWEEGGNKPFTAGGEDPRYVVRALRMITTLADLKRSNQAPWEWSKTAINVRPWQVWDEIVDTWFKRNGKSLDTACKKVLELKEQVLLQGIWLPADDKLEQLGTLVD